MAPQFEPQRGGSIIAQGDAAPTGQGTLGTYRSRGTSPERAKEQVARQRNRLFRPFRARSLFIALNPELEPARSLAPAVLRDRSGSAPWAMMLAPPRG